MVFGGLVLLGIVFLVLALGSWAYLAFVARRRPLDKIGSIHEIVAAGDSKRDSR